MNTYPKILIPNEVKKIKNLKPKLPNQPKKPEVPLKKTPVKPNEIAQDSGVGFAFVIQLILIGGGLLLSGIGLPIGGIMIIGGVVLLFYWIFNWNKIQDDKKRDYLKYQSDLKEYNFLLLNSEKIYRSEIEKYENLTLLKYKEDIERYEKLKTITESNSYLNNFRRNELIKYFKDSTKPTIVDKFYSKGVSESYFKSYLNTYFKDCVKTNYCIVDDSFDGIPFNPDFLIIDDEFQIYLDIEIDEPYIGNNGTPIHFTDGNDDYRNTFFLDNKWIVVRFAEIQIIKYPNECCKVIQDIIKSIKSDNEIDEKLIKNKIENFACWDKDEANRLAYMRFRNKYLSSQLIENLQQEEMELEKKFLNVQLTDEYDDLPF